MKNKKLFKRLIIALVIVIIGFIAFKWYIKSINMDTTHNAPETTHLGTVNTTEKGVVINEIDHLSGSYGLVIEKSNLFFEVGGTTAATGKFTEYTINFDLDSNIKSLMVTIATKSINTTNKMRDEHLREADFFNVEKYPQITFKSSSIYIGDTSWIAQGTMNFLGKDHPMFIPFVYKGAVKDTENTEYFEGKFQFDRVKLGMKSDATIDDIVTVKFFCELKKQN